MARKTQKVQQYQRQSGARRSCRAKPVAASPRRDDTTITALALEPGTLSDGMAGYFAKCQEKLGFVPNVLEGLCLRQRQARSLRRHVQRPDAGAVGPVQARARDDRGRGVVAQPLLLLPGGARRRGARAVGRSAARRTDGDELSRRAAEQAPARHARLRGQAHRRALERSRSATARRCAARASPTATSGTSPRSRASST